VHRRVRGEVAERVGCIESTDALVGRSERDTEMSVSIPTVRIHALGDVQVNRSESTTQLPSEIGVVPTDRSRGGTDETDCVERV
jgi:hypothetical protein